MTSPFTIKLVWGKFSFRQKSRTLSLDEVPWHNLSIQEIQPYLPSSAGHKCLLKSIKNIPVWVRIAIERVLQMGGE